MREPSKPFLPLLLQDLTDPDEAAAYVMAAREDSREMFLTAIRDVAQAHQMAKVAKESGVARENLYRAFSEAGNPTLTTFDSVLDAIGLEYEVVPKGTAKSKAESSGSLSANKYKNQHKAGRKGRSRHLNAATYGQLPLFGQIANADIASVVVEVIPVQGSGQSSSGNPIQLQQIPQRDKLLDSGFNNLNPLVASTINYLQYAGV